MSTKMKAVTHTPDLQNTKKKPTKGKAIDFNLPPNKWKKSSPAAVIKQVQTWKPKTR